YGMQTMNQSLYELYVRRLITLEEAMGRSSIPDELQSMISRGGVATAHNPRESVGKSMKVSGA
ncbi:MAG: hypothetical protein L0Y56_04870, partial [Nitrospira sp.]|nr:hypothetical protein [Nitrospira sp.]